MSNGQNTGRRYIPKFFTYNGSTEWRPNIAYSAKTIVTRNFKIYTSIVNVPSNIGSPEDNPKYWQPAVINDEVMQTIIEELGKLDGDAISFEHRLEVIENKVGELEVVIGEVQDEVEKLKNALTTKAEQDGAYSDLTAGQMLSKVETSDSVPYNFRAVGHDATLEYTDAIVGASLVQNQLIQNGNFVSADGWTYTGVTLSAENNVLSATLTSTSNLGQFVNSPVWSSIADHKYIYVFDIKAPKAVSGGRVYHDAHKATAFSVSTANTWQTIGGIATNTTAYNNCQFQIFFGNVETAECEVGDVFYLRNVMLIDLTQTLGTAIADYVYTLETATAGAGVAWLKKHFPKLFTYQPYNAGEIVSVQGLSQHITRDADNNIIGTYPLDDSLTLRGILKLDASNNLYADGDRYLPDGTVQRRYGVVDLGTAAFVKAVQGGNDIFYTNLPGGMQIAYFNGICTKYPEINDPNYATDKMMRCYGSTSYGGFSRVGIRDDSYTSASDFTTAMSGVYLVYELAEPTTEEADPYTTPQIIDPNGTEEYVSTSIVPVGHESRYPLDIAGRLDKILTMPTENGTYTLRATLNNGAVTYAWVST